MLKRTNKPTKPWKGAENCRVVVPIAFLILILAVFILFLMNKEEKPSNFINLSKIKWNTFQSSVHLNPTLEFRNGTDVIWQIPDSPKAVLFLAHGCNGRAVNFWDKSPSCPNCIGLPEERLIVLHALARKFAILTISSAGRCWSFGEEREIVKGSIRWWIKKNKLENLPLMALGASSGGYFVSVLATDVRFNSITLMIAEGKFDEMDIPNDYPPTLFVHMPKDRFISRMVGKNMDVLRHKGIDVKEIKCMEFPLSPNLLADRIPGLDKTVSTKLFELFHQKGFIDKRGYMKNDGRGTRWKEAVRERKDLLPNKFEWIHHIQEELNLAFAYHEMTSLQSDKIFDWFVSHMI